MTNNRNIRKTHQNGNVLFLILIAVALFAALSYVVTQSSRTGSGDAARDKARLSASNILNQVTGVQTAVSRLVLGKCAPELLNFASPYDSININPNAPPDGHCDVFLNNGGGAVPQQAPEGSVTPDPNYYFVGSSALHGIGSTCSTPNCGDLVMTLYGVNDLVCEQLNIMNGIKVQAATLTDTQQACPYKGTFDCNGNGTTEQIFSSAALKGKNSVCWKDTVHGLTFSHVLLSR